MPATVPVDTAEAAHPAVAQLSRSSSRSSMSDTTANGISDDRKILDEKDALKLPAQGDDEDPVNGPLATANQAAVRPVIPWKYRIMAWSFIVFWGTGCWLAEQALGPLKATMKRELNITSESAPTLGTRHSGWGWG